MQVVTEFQIEITPEISGSGSQLSNDSSRMFGRGAIKKIQ